MLDDELVLKAAEGVDYSSLPSMPSPEDFYLLSRVKGETSVAQLCAASGWGKEKARDTIQKLLEFGLLEADGYEAAAATPEPQPEPTPEPEPIAEIADDQTSRTTQERPAVDALGNVVGEGKEREREVTPARTPVVEREEPVRQEPQREPVKTPVRDERVSSFNLPVIEEDEDDLFMSDSPAHLSRLNTPRQPGDPSNTRPFDEGEDFASSLEAETNAGDDEIDAAAASMVEEDPEPTPAAAASEPGFAILDSEVAQDEHDGATQMLDPTSLDIASSVAFDSERVKTNRGGAAVDGPLAFAMLPGEVTEFTLPPELLDPALEIAAEARREVAYVHSHLDAVTHYALFGVEPEANRKEIKKAYFVLSKRFHPDLYFRKNVGPFGDMVEDVFKAVTNAYGVLSHRKKRAQYDEELKQQASARTVKSAGGSSELEQKKELARELLLKRASTHHAKGEFVRAADCYRKALAIRSEPEVLVQLANALYRANKRLDDAAKYCRSALRQNPKNLDGMLVLAKILERNEAYEDALRVLDRAKTISADEPSIAVHEERLRNLMSEG